MNSLEERKSCQRAAIDIEMMISKRLAVLEEQLALMKKNGYGGKCYCATEFNETVLEMVFDAIHHSVEYSNNVGEMELFRDQLLGAVDKLSCLVNIWEEGEKRRNNSVHHVDFTRL
ncbi:MAG: hypothetical protein ABFR19_05460 [Pseudomonadota bacterium]